MSDYKNTPSANKSEGSTFMFVITTLAVLALIGASVLCVMESGKLKKANQNIAALEANNTSLTGQLTISQNTVASLQTQLSTEKENVAFLTSSLSAANSKATAAQSSLDKALTDLTAANSAKNSLNAELIKIKDPRHFNTIQELTDWLAKDDTNTNEAYASMNGPTRAYVLQVKALRDGYLLPAYITWSATNIAGINLALVGADIYLVNPLTDAVAINSVSFASALPSHPLPLS